jgi:HAD superfamily hydrolase (TIGR01484 family)
MTVPTITPPLDVTAAPAPLATCDTRVMCAVDRLFFDVDDTLTWEGVLPLEAHQALVDARKLGLTLVAVTGRSAAWAEMMLRLFRLDAAIAETGALAFVREGGRVVVIDSENDRHVRAENDRRRRQAAERVLATVPGARLAIDMPGRVYDVAFDLIEDGPKIDDETAARIRAILVDEGLTVTQSSVHINAWFGSFDKASMVDRVLRTCFSSSLDAASATLAYVGDSQNDGPLFARAGVSVGVANIAPSLETLRARGQAPRFLVEGQGGFGFAQVVAALAAARAGPSA